MTGVQSSKFCPRLEVLSENGKLALQLGISPGVLEHDPKILLKNTTISHCFSEVPV
jgi:hypothetical protein